MVHSRNKGHNRERAIRHRFIAAGWPDAKRGDQSRAGHEESDVCVGARQIPVYEWPSPQTVLVPGFRCEVKDQLSLPGKRVMAAYDQAARASVGDQVPLAVFHVARRGDFVLLELGHLLQLASCGTANDRGGGDHGESDGDSGERPELQPAEDVI